MRQHENWIKRGFDDGVFLLVGALNPGYGGAILAKSDSKQEIRQRIAEDPFLKEGIVRAEIIEIRPSKADGRINFLLG